MRNSQFTQKKCYPHQRSPRQMEIKFSDQHARLKLHSKTPTFLQTSRLVLQFKRSFLQHIFLKASVLKARIHIIYTLFKAKIFPVGAALRQFYFMATVSSSALEGCKLSLFQQIWDLRASRDGEDLTRQATCLQEPSLDRRPPLANNNHRKMKRRKLDHSWPSDSKFKSCYVHIL